jgi:Fe-S oxidoreductase
MRIAAIVLSLVATAVALGLFAQALRGFWQVIGAGGPALNRTDNKAARWKNMFKETLGHTRMLQWTWIGIMHWLVFAGFIFLSSAVATAYFQIFDPHFTLWIVGEWYPFEWATELLSWLTVIGILYLIVVRQRNHPRRLERKSRFFGSTFWQAYFVEAIILGEGLAGLFIRGAEYQLHDGTKAHFPMTWFIGSLYGDISDHTAENIIYALATAKILMAMVWLGTISKNITMGVAWHRFTAWFNIWFKRESDGRVALGGLKPMTVDGKRVDMEAMEELDEDDFGKLGVGKVEDFSWKGILDFTTCTECGRCQSQCPAWNTEKPLSPKLLMMGLREHAYTKIPLLQKDGDTLTEAEQAELERPLIGDESMYGVIDPDVLWSCTNCGACVQQCPVDIEHVDHIDDMRRYQVLVESNFPAELNNIFKGLERKGNPWNMNPRDRMAWAKDLEFEVKQVGVDVEDLDEVEWLFWVGCAGAYEDRAKKTTQAVAELLDMAGVTFAVLGDGETCSGDSARRAGNEVLFMQLAMQNAEVFKETKVKKVVSTCAHCFNTLKNEYREFGVELEVVHHTQLLNRLVREKKLTPVAPTAGEAAGKKITYHDPCFLGRHNQVYEAPRELLQIIPGATYAEMPRNSEKSFCCGAGGARMWMEETLGSRINVNRTEEAVATGADQIAVGCPFCRVMLSDGLTAKQAAGEAREEVEVLDVAQMLLASVKRPPVEPSAEDDQAVVAEAEAATAAAATASTAPDGLEAKDDAESVEKPEDVGVGAEAAKEQAEGGSPTSGVTEADDAEEVAEELNDPATDESGAGAEAQQVAAEHNVEVDESGSASGREPDDAEAEAADEPTLEAEVEQADEAETARTEPDATPEAAEPETSTDESADEAAEPLTEAEAKADEAEPVAETEPVAEAEPVEATPAPEPEATAEEPVQGELSFEADEPGTAPAAEVTAVEDEAHPDVAEDVAPLSEANPSGAELSETATDAAAADEDGDEPEGEPKKA